MSRSIIAGLFITLVCLAPLKVLRAQYHIHGSITGTDLQPLPFTVLSILDARDSAVWQTAYADSAGLYKLELPDVKHKLIKASGIGYENAIKVVADVAEQEIDFVLTAQHAALDEVSITTSRPLLERKPDRTIFNVSASITATGGNALDALKKVPGVWIRQQDNTINLVGKSAVQVLINDRLQQLSGEDLMALLQAIPSENIDRIEVITTPPARYDASGNAGFVNIVLKKNNRQGINGSMRAAYEQASYGKGIAGGDINYRKGKLNLYGNGSYSHGANAITERLNTPYPGQLFKVTDAYKKTMKPLQYTLGADYELHKNGVLGLQFASTTTNRLGDDNTGIRVLQLPAMALDSTLRTLGNSTMKNTSNVLNANYVWSIDTAGRKLSFNVNRLWFDGRRSNDFSTMGYGDDFTTPTGSNSKNKTEGLQHIRITTAQADVALPAQWLSLSFGAKLSFISNRSDNRFAYFYQDAYYEDQDISNAFDYSEKVQALYISAEKTIGKWAFQAGLRGEYTQTTGYSRNLDQTNHNQYINLFPTGYIQYQLSDKHSFNLNYSRRINRPDYRSLDPYRAYATPYHYGQGNPFLRPSFNNNAELVYTWNSRYTFSVFYQYEQDHFGSVWMIDQVHNITSGLSKNFAGFTAYGINATGALQPFPFWEMQAQLSIQQQQLRSKEYTATEQSYKLPLYYASVNNSFILNKKRTVIAEANFFYLSKYREDFLEIDPIGSADLGIKVLLLDRRLAVALNAADIFATQKARGVHVVTGQRIDNYFDSRNVRLSLSYSFGNSALKARRERNTGIEEEKGRAGQ